MLEPRLINRDIKTVAATLAAAQPEGPDARLLGLAGRTEELFQLGSPYARGLVYIGGMARLDRFLNEPGEPVSLSGGGSGLDLATALAACLGETVEYACQFPARAEVRTTDYDMLLGNLTASGQADAIGLWRAPAAPPRAVDLIPAINLATGAGLDLPAAVFLRAQSGDSQLGPAIPLGSGIAAGRTAAEAADRAVLELIERDAAARWWCFGQPGRALAPSQLGEDYRDVERVLDRSETLRRSWLVDISTHLPVVAALSCDHEGRHLAVGLAARRGLAEAATAATIEMCQMELSLALIHGRVRHRGEAALTPFERRHLDRSRHLCANDHSILRPRVDSQGPVSATGAGGAVALASSLKGQGISIYTADLTCLDLGIPVIAARSPQLLPVPTDAQSNEDLAALHRAPLSELFARGFMLL
jgi:ribosomal protein S12 methylthiotransferase accessory factor YcaO